MRLDISTENRPGITLDVLAALRPLALDLRAMEVETHHIYLDIPSLTAAILPKLGTLVMAVDGVRAYRPVDRLPGEARRLHLDALLAAVPDPVLWCDGDGTVRLVNEAAATAFGLPEQRLAGRTATALFARAKLETGAEIALNETPYQMEVIAVSDEAGESAGQLIVLRAPAGLGRTLARLSAPMADGGGFRSILGEAPALRTAIERAKRFAPIDAPVLIQGATGTGKELFARALHDASTRAGGPFLALNCASLPENLVESELFGYAPGAFSGASQKGKIGLVELAVGGTIFLDEIGELSGYVQAKLLRFLADGSFRRIGGKAERRSDARVLAATHRNLSHLVSDNRFREDLLYRLSVLTLDLPSLAERRTDIPLLARHFVDRAARQIDRPAPVLDTGLLDALTRHPWPGNVRQLENTLFRLVALADGDRLTADLLADPRPTAAVGTMVAGMETAVTDLPSAVRRFEADLLARLKNDYPSSRKLAARLGVSHATIAEKLKRYGL